MENDTPKLVTPGEDLSTGTSGQNNLDPIIAQVFAPFFTELDQPIINQNQSYDTRKF